METTINKQARESKTTILSEWKSINLKIEYQKQPKEPTREKAENADKDASTDDK